MKITHKSGKEIQYVVNHYVGEVYQDTASDMIYLLAGDNDGGYRFINLETYASVGLWDSLSEVDKSNRHDILVDAELVIHEGE